MHSNHKQSQDYSIDDSNNNKEESVQSNSGMDKVQERKLRKKPPDLNQASSTLNLTKALVHQIIDERDSEENVVSLLSGIMYCTVNIKETVSRDFRPLVFFINQLHIGP
jgi:hypothetical protein